MGITFRRNKTNKIEAVNDQTGRVSEIDDMSDFAAFRDKWPMTPDEYVLMALGEKEGREILKQGPARNEIIKRLGVDDYESMLKDGVIKDPEYK